MSTLICDFMADSYLENVAEKLCELKPGQFSHLLAHRKPNQQRRINKLKFLDATQLYRHENLPNCFKGLTVSSISLSQSVQLEECQILFTSAFDRTSPTPQSVHYVQHFFWDLAGYYVSFFKDNRKVDSLLFDNTPHLPWDICLFFVAKMLNKKVIFMRKTGIRGYVYIDEDFRPNKGSWGFDYNGLSNPLRNIVAKDDFYSDLDSLSFSKGQVSGMWPVDAKVKLSIFSKFLDVLRSMGLDNTVRFLGVIIRKPPNNYSVATNISEQKTTLAGMSFVNRWNFVKIHLAYVSALRYRTKLYDKLSSKSIEWDKPFVYFSLHLQPERTTLPEGLVYDDQVMAIRTLADALPSGWKLLVKEHPRQMKYDVRSIHARSCLDYERLNEIENVEIIPLSVSQSKLIQRCKCTATISGSVSWEGLLLGKPSLIFSENWHTDCKSTYFVTSVKDAKDALLNLRNLSVSNVHTDLCVFISNAHEYLINAALNANHLRMFFSKKNQNISLNNISSAILQRLNDK